MKILVINSICQYIFISFQTKNMKSIFNAQDVADIIGRINQLTPQTERLWGKMDVAQMLAHCNITYELVYEDIHPKPNAFVKLLLKLLVKDNVVNEKPYKSNGQTDEISNGNKVYCSKYLQEW